MTRTRNSEFLRATHLPTTPRLSIQSPKFPPSPLNTPATLPKVSMNDPRYHNSYLPFHHATNHFQARQLGTVTTVNTTPPSVRIRPSDGGDAITSLNLSQNQLTTILNNLAIGAAQVSYIPHYYLYWISAADVQCTGIVHGHTATREAPRQDQLQSVPIIPSQRGERGTRRTVETSGRSVRYCWRSGSWVNGSHGI